MGSDQQGHDTTKVFSTPILGDVEVVDVPFPLPLESEEMEEENARYFIKAYCSRCEKDTVHVIYANAGDIITKCTICGNMIYHGGRIDAFVKLYCPSCQRETIHSVSALGIVCVSCGRTI